VIKKIAKEAITNEINSNINESFDKFKTNMTPEQRNFAKQFATANKIPLDILTKMYSRDNIILTSSNEWLYSMNIMYLTLLIVILTTIILVTYMSCMINVPWMQILKENIVLFICVGVVEYLFFTNIALKFIPIEPSLIVNTVLDEMKKSL